MAGVGGKKDEEILACVRRFVERSPAGEIEYVANDVRRLLGGDELFIENEAIIQSMFRENNVKNFVKVSGKRGGSEILLTEHGEVENEGRFSYYDPESDKVLSVDHIKRECLEERDANEEERTPSSVKEMR